MLTTSVAATSVSPPGGQSASTTSVAPGGGPDGERDARCAAATLGEPLRADSHQVFTKWLGEAFQPTTESRLAFVDQLEAAFRQPGRAPDACFPAMPAIVEPRDDTMNVFGQFIDCYDMTNRRSFAELTWNMQRVPIAVVSGGPGTGKSTLLAIAARAFPGLRPGGRVLYAGLTPDAQEEDFDAGCPTDVRVAHRLLHAASGAASVRHSVTNARTALGMAPPSSSPAALSPREQGFFPDKLLSNPMVLDTVIRRLLGAEETAPLLICADELRKLGAQPEVGETPHVALSVLWSLTQVSQAAAARIAGAREAGRGGRAAATYVAASVGSYLDPMSSVMVPGGRCVYWLSLPPLPVAKWDGALVASMDMAAIDGATKARARHDLWLALGHARGLDAAFRALERDPRTSPTATDWAPAVEAFLAAAARKYADPIDLLRVLFAPVYFGSSNRNYEPGSGLTCAILAEEAGICNVVRRWDDRVDTVWMHPRVALEVCEGIEGQRRRTGTVAAIGGAFIGDVKRLCRLLFLNPTERAGVAVDGDALGVGKCYEQIVSLALACRVGAAGYGTAMTVGELLYGRGVRMGGLADVHVSVGRAPREVALQRSCTPAACADAVPWRSRLLGECDVIADSVLGFRIHPAGARASVALGLIHGGAQRGARCRQMAAGDSACAVESFLGAHEFIQVLVTPHSLVGDKTLRTWSLREGGHELHEAVLTREDVARWCPMMSHSACDVRLAQLATGPPSV